MPTILNFTDLQKMLELEKSSFSDYPDLQVIADSVHAALENYCGRMLDYAKIQLIIYRLKAVFLKYQKIFIEQS